jgi:hypothetical protein
MILIFFLLFTTSVEQFDDLEQTRPVVLASLDAVDLVPHLIHETIEFVFHIDAFAVRVESNENHATAVIHEEIVVPDLLVARIVGPVRELVRLNTHKRPADQLSVVDPSPHRTVAATRVERLVMDETFEVCVDGVSDANFLRVLIYPFASVVVGKLALETRRAIVVVLFTPATRINPIDTVRTAYTTTVVCALVGCASSTSVTSLFSAPFPTAVTYAEIGCADSTIVTTRFSAPFPTAVTYAESGCALSTFVAPTWESAPFPTTVSNAPLGCALSSGWTTLFSAPFPTAVTFAEIGCAFSTIVTTLFSAPFPTTVLDAPVGCADSTVVATRFSAPIPTTVLLAVFGCAGSTFVTTRFSAPIPTAMLDAPLGTALSLFGAPT